MKLIPDYQYKENEVCHFCGKRKAKIGRERNVYLQHVFDHTYIAPIAYSYVRLEVLIPQCEKCNKYPTWYIWLSRSAYLLVMIGLVKMVASMDLSFWGSVIMYIFCLFICLLLLSFIMIFFEKACYLFSRSPQFKSESSHPIIKRLKGHNWAELTLKNKSVFGLHADAKYFRNGDFEQDIRYISQKFHYIFNEEENKKYNVSREI